MRSLVCRCSLLALALILTACGGGGVSQTGSAGAPVMRSVHGAVVKGPLAGATVSFFHVDVAGNPAGAAIGTATTDARGHVTTGLPSVAEPILAVTSGGSYVDESDDAGGDDRRRITLSNEQHFEAIVPANADTFVLTPYSMAVLLRARRLAQGVNFGAVYQAVLQQATTILGFDPTAVIPADPLDPAGGGDPKYGLILGGAAYAINTIATGLGAPPSYPIVRAFIDDLSDGRLDGKLDDGELQLKVQSIGDADLNGEILRFRNNHFGLYGNLLAIIDEDLWAIDPVIPQIFPPVAASDAIEVAEGGSASALVGGATSVLANDDDPQESPLTAILVTPPAHGELVLNADGTFSYAHDGSETTGDVFTYKANNGVQDSPPATVTITITPVNEAPEAINDRYEGHQGQLLQITPPGVLFNDNDPDGDTLIPQLVDLPLHGTLTLGSEGGFTFRPDPGFVGDDAFTYRAVDGHGGRSGLTTVTLAIAPTAAPPVANSDSYRMAANGRLDVPAPGVLGNDGGAEPLTAVLDTSPVGTLVLHADGSFSYEPPEGFSGTTHFQYHATNATGDSNAASVQIVVQGSTTPGNQPPVGVSDSFSWTGATLHGNVLTNDFDPDGDALTVQLVAGPTLGTLTLNANGSFDYDFAGCASGKRRGKFLCQDQFSYRVSDGQATSGIVVVTIDIVPPNQAPVAAADSYTVSFGGSIDIPAPGLLANDSDPDGDPITVDPTPDTDPSQGSVTLNPDGSFHYQHTPVLSKAALGSDDQFSYHVTDGSLPSNSATVTIHINQTPFGLADSYLVDQGGTLTVAAPGVLANDGDPEGDSLTVVKESDPALGTLTLNADGSFEYVNTADGAEDSFTYRVDDGTGQSSLVTVTITINHAPAGTDDLYSIDSSHPAVIPAANGVLANDSDAEGDALTVTLDTPPTLGTLILNADGSFAYQSNGTSFGGADSFKYVISDGRVQSAPVTVTLNFLICDGACGPTAHRYAPVLTSDGQTVVFLSHDPNLVPGKTTTFDDMFVTTFNSALAAKASRAKASVDGGTTFRLMGLDAGPNDGDVTTGAEPQGDVVNVNVTPDGHYVVFTTHAKEYGLATVGTSFQVYRYSLMAPDAGEIVLVSSKDGPPALGDGFFNGFPLAGGTISISDNGQFVVFDSNATDLTGVTIDTVNAPEQVYLRDITNTETTLVSVDACGFGTADTSAYASSISADGSLISFETDADNLTTCFSKARAKALARPQTFVRDLASFTTFTVSVDALGNDGDGNSVRSRLSPDGSLIAIETFARNLVSSDTTDPSFTEVVVHNLSSNLFPVAIGENLRVSRAFDGGDPDGSSELAQNPFSADNSLLTFASRATNLVDATADTNGVQDIFVYRFGADEMLRVNLDAEGNQAVDGSNNQRPSLSRDGSTLAFDSNSINFEDPTGFQQVYLRDVPAVVPKTLRRPTPRR